jgi:GDPmannose 4,6-dehydratase
VELHTAPVDNHLSIYRVISKVQPHEVYHLAASSFVSYSFDDESSILNQNFNSTHYILIFLERGLCKMQGFPCWF